jgi:hypothetical protein
MCTVRNNRFDFMTLVCLPNKCPSGIKDGFTYRLNSKAHRKLDRCVDSSFFLNSALASSRVQLNKCVTYFMPSQWLLGIAVSFVSMRAVPGEALMILSMCVYSSIILSLRVGSRDHDSCWQLPPKMDIFMPNAFDIK